MAANRADTKELAPARTRDELRVWTQKCDAVRRQTKSGGHGTLTTQLGKSWALCVLRR